MSDDELDGRPTEERPGIKRAEPVITHLRDLTSYSDSWWESQRNAPVIPLHGFRKDGTRWILYKLDLEEEKPSFHVLPVRIPADRREWDSYFRNFSEQGWAVLIFSGTTGDAIPAPVVWVEEEYRRGSLADALLNQSNRLVGCIDSEWFEHELRSQRVIFHDNLP